MRALLVAALTTVLASGAQAACKDGDIAGRWGFNGWNATCVIDIGKSGDITPVECSALPQEGIRHSLAGKLALNDSCQISGTVSVTAAQSSGGETAEFAVRGNMSASTWFNLLAQRAGTLTTAFFLWRL